jgi:hypothetical protein
MAAETSPVSRAHGCGVTILPTDADVRRFLARRAPETEGRSQGDLHIGATLRAAIDGPCLGQHGATAIHLPIADDRSMRHNLQSLPKLPELR